MKKSVSVIVSMIVLGLVGCEKKYSVSEMVKDSELRKEVFQKCDEGKYEPMGANCINAKKAQAIHLRNLRNAVSASVTSE